MTVELTPALPSLPPATAAQLRLIAEHVPVMMALFDGASDRCLYANAMYAHAFGLDESSVLGRSFVEIVGPVAMLRVQGHLNRLKADCRPVTYVRLLEAPGQAPRWIEVDLIPHLDVKGRLLTTVVLAHDITRRREAEQRLRASELRLEKFMHATLEGIIFHRHGVITDANPPLCTLVGYPLDEMVGRPVLEFIATDEPGEAAALMNGDQEVRCEAALVHRDGTHIPAEFNLRTLEFGNEEQRMLVVRDIRDRVAAQARIQQLAHRDALTQLLNRSAFLERLQPSVQRAHSEGRTLALLSIDLDDFKRVNDSLGHREGDKVLATVAQRISGCLRETDLVARFGGDEFMVLLNDLKSRDDVLAVLGALLGVVEVPVAADGRDLWVTPSIGVAMFPEHGEDAEQLIQHANTAMYLAKANGRASYEFFRPALAQRAYAELVIESELAAALERGEFRLHYQPQVTTADGRLIGVEALLRWQHPERGLLAPDAFLAVAERHWLMVPLSEWVLAEAARQARRWHEAGMRPVRIAVNLSSLQFRLDSFAGNVRRVLADTGAEAAWLELELTERMLMDDLGRAPDTLTELRALGLSISVDDFGTGHTSLAHLTQLPLDKLKVDQSFVAKLPHDKGAVAITRAIVQMGKGLGLKVAAEGLRNTEQWALLAEWGCDELQGEWIGPPMSAENFEQWLQKEALQLAPPPGTAS